MNNKHEQAFLANDLADAKVKKAVDLPYEALPLVSAVCPCGYKGKSKQPQYYRCGYCYHAGRANGLAEKIATLEARIVKLREEREQRIEQASQFRKRHPEAGGGKPLRAVPSRKSGLVFPAKSGSTTKA